MNMTAYDREEELLAWQERMLTLRASYLGVPGGFTDTAAAEKEAENLTRDRASLAARQVPGLEGESLSRWQHFRAAERIPFVGRDAELSRIREAFASSCGPVILYGIGGIGKTAIASEYARRYQGAYEQILILTCQGTLEQLFCDDYQVPVKGLHYQQSKYRSRSRYFTRKLQELQRIFAEHKTLLVIDDWNRPEIKKQKKLFDLPCDLLITTRLHPSQWSAGTCVPIDAFQSREEWDAFFEALGIDRMDPSSEALRLRTSGHTLSMILATHSGDALPHLLMHLGEDETSAAHAVSPDSTRILQNLLREHQLRETDRQALRELAPFSRTGIPRDRYLAISHTSEKTLQRLADHLLIALQPGDDSLPEHIFMHPVIAEAVFRLLKPNPANCRGLLAGFGEIAGDAWIRSHEENQREVPRVLALLRAFPRPEPWMFRIYDRLLILLMMEEYPEEVIPRYQALLELVRKAYGENHQNTGEMQLRVAAAHFNAQDYAAAAPWYEAAYRTLRNCPERDPRWEHLMAEAAGKMSRVMRGRKDYAGALTYIREALLHEEAAVLRAEKLRTGRTAGRINDLPELSAYLTYYFWQLDLGKIYIRTGHLPEARKCLETVESLLKKDARALRYFTENFTRTELDKYRLELLTSEKQFEQAEQLAEDMIAYALRARDPLHSYTLGIRLRRADLRAAEGRQGAAAAEYREILQILRAEHPFWTEQIQRTEQRLRNPGQVDALIR